VGAGAGLLIIMIDQLILKPRGAKFRMHVMPVAVGMYLPIGLSLALVIGGILTWFASMGGKSGEAKRSGLERGVILSSGLIAGEAMAGLLMAGITVYLNTQGEGKTLDSMIEVGASVPNILTVVFIGGMCAILIKVSRPAKG